MTPAWKLSIRILFCIAIGGAFLYFHINKQNQLTALRLEIPVIAKELKAIQEENKRLKFEIDRFKNPTHLIQLAQKAEFAHLTYPFNQDLIVLPSSPPLSCHHDTTFPCRAP